MENKETEEFTREHKIAGVVFIIINIFAMGAESWLDFLGI